MTVIGKKDKKAGVMIGMYLLFGLILMGLMLFYFNIFILCCGAFSSFLALVLLVEYFLMPVNAIAVNNNGNLVLAKKGEIQVKDITTVTYSDQGRRKSSFSWGSVKIITKHGTFTCKYIADYKNVVENINKLRYHAK